MSPEPPLSRAEAPSAKRDRRHWGENVITLLSLNTDLRGSFMTANMTWKRKTPMWTCKKHTSEKVVFAGEKLASSIKAAEDGASGKANSRKKIVKQ